MKKTKVYIYGIAYYSDGTSKTSRNYIDPEAFSRWCNRQFHIDEDVTIYEYHWDMSTLESKQVSTWHA